MTDAATAPRAVDAAHAIEQAAHAFEEKATRVSAIVGRRAIAWQSIARAAAAAGMDPAVVAPALADQNARATAEAAQWQTWVNDLAAGRAELVPYQVGNEPIRLGVRYASQTGLGWWPIASTILTIGSRAAMATMGWLSFDAWNDTQQVEANARATDANTRAALVATAQANPQVATQLIGAMRNADNESRDAGPDWIDRLSSAATGAAAGIGSGALILLGLYLFTRNKSKPRKTNPRRRSRRRYR